MYMHTVYDPVHRDFPAKKHRIYTVITYICMILANPAHMNLQPMLYY